MLGESGFLTIQNNLALIVKLLDTIMFLDQKWVLVMLFHIWLKDF